MKMNAEFIEELVCQRKISQSLFLFQLIFFNLESGRLCQRHFMC